jgi:hypothetical protein
VQLRSTVPFFLVCLFFNVGRKTFPSKLCSIHFCFYIYMYVCICSYLKHIESIKIVMIYCAIIITLINLSVHLKNLLFWIKLEVLAFYAYIVRNLTLSLWFLFWFSETGSCCVAQADLEFIVLLPLPLKCEAYRYALPTWPQIFI